jgi:hypothetical protein
VDTAQIQTAPALIAEVFKMTLEDLGYRVGFVGEDWCVIRPDGSYAVAIDSDVSASCDLESAFGGLEPEWIPA